MAAAAAAAPRFKGILRIVGASRDCGAQLASRRIALRTAPARARAVAAQRALTLQVRA
jgi:hypothetical protein